MFKTAFLQKNVDNSKPWYLKGFHTYNKINNSFLKFDHSLLRMSRIIEIDHIFPAEKRDFKT